MSMMSNYNDGRSEPHSAAKRPVPLDVLLQHTEMANERFTTYSLVNCRSAQPHGQIRGTWVQDCIGTITDAIERAKGTSSVNGGQVIAVVDSVSSSVPILMGEEGFAPIAIVDRNTRIVRDKID